MQPVVKWIGSKRKQASEICKNIQKKYDVYYEPFCGSCAMLAHILQHMPERFNEFRISDLNPDLIRSYNMIKYNPGKVVSRYAKMWSDLNSLEPLDKKKDYFNFVRDRLNSIHDPADFIFIMRTTVNGMPRYNSDGKFNNSFHVTRNGMHPDTFRDLVMKWSGLLNSHDVKFSCRSYDTIFPLNNDLVYFDPPYENTNGMYFGDFDNKKFLDYLKRMPCDWMLSYDGMAGTNDMTAAIPKELYKRHIFLDNGNSAMRRVVGNDGQCNVKESLYMNFDIQAVGEDLLF